MSNVSDTKDRELVADRLIHAPRNLVFEMWTSPEHMPKWWGPNGFTNTIHDMDVTTGGFCHYTMHGPDGTDYPNYMSFKEVIPNEKIEYLHGTNAEDAKEGFHVVTLFEEEGEGTRIIMRMTFESAEEKQRKVDGGAGAGQFQHINRLQDYIAFKEAGDSLFTTSHIFNVPLELLYEVHTQKEHLANFWGPKEAENEIIEFDFRTGGRIFYSMAFPQGKTYGQQIYREIVENKRITMFTTFCNESGEAIRPPMSETWPLYMLNSMDFEAIDKNRAKLTIKGVPYNATVAEHDTYKAGHESMQNGYGGTLRALEDYLQTLTK